MAAYKRNIPSIADTLRPTDPIYKVCQMPQLMYVKAQNYGLKQLYARLKDVTGSARFGSAWSNPRY